MMFYLWIKPKSIPSSQNPLPLVLVEEAMTSPLRVSSYTIKPKAARMIVCLCVCVCVSLSIFYITGADLE
jgi:hypothetical protein